MAGKQIPPGPDHTFVRPAGIPGNLFPANEMETVDAASFPESSSNSPNDISGVGNEI
jgi:hypothetical protein